MNIRTFLRRLIRQQVFRHYKRIVATTEWGAYCRATETPKLHLGCGGNKIPGWFNTDLYPGFGAAHLDFSRPMPFPDNTFDAVQCEHTIEHVPKVLALTMCRETYRVLKIGGGFRIVTPGLDLIAGYMLQPDSRGAKRFLALTRELDKNPSLSLTDAVNDMFYRHGHQYLYDQKELAALLKAAGFSEIRQLTIGECGLPELAGVDGHGNATGDEFNALHSIAVEARK